ncbi:MAG: hypothetical protein ABIJ58_01735 [Nanoarchaeota archaeon]
MNHFEELDNLYNIVLRIAFAIIFYISAQYINNETSKIVFLLISFCLLGLSLFEILKYHFSRNKEVYSRHKKPIIILSFALVIIVVFIILYLQQGRITDVFWVTLIPSIIAWLVTSIKILLKE